RSSRTNWLQVPVCLPSRQGQPVPVLPRQDASQGACHGACEVPVSDDSLRPPSRSAHSSASLGKFASATANLPQALCAFRANDHNFRDQETPGITGDFDFRLLTSATRFARSVFAYAPTANTEPSYA